MMQNRKKTAVPLAEVRAVALTIYSCASKQNPPSQKSHFFAFHLDSSSTNACKKYHTHEKRLYYLTVQKSEQSRF